VFDYLLWSPIVMDRPLYFAVVVTMFGRILGWYTIYTFLGACCPVTEFCQVQNSLRPSLVFSYIANVTARPLSSERQQNFVAWYKESNCRTFADGATYTRQGAPRWASAHILVV